MAAYVTEGSISASSNTPSESIGNQLSPDLKALYIYQLVVNAGDLRWEDLHRPMHQKKVKVVRTQILERLVKTLFNILGCMLGIPELSRDEDVRPLHAAFADTFANFDFIAVDGGAVDMLVSAFECNFNSLLDLAWGGLPCSKPNGRNLGSRVEGEIRLERHGEWCIVVGAKR